MNCLKSTLFVLLLLFFHSSWAGWKIITVSNDAEGNQIETITYFQDGKIRIESEGMTMIFNVESGNLLMVVPEYGLHWSGTLDQMIEEMQVMMGEMMKMMGDEAYNNYLEEIEKQKQKSSTEITGVEIIEDGELFESAGFKGYKYRVMKDGELREEMWVTEEINLSKEVDVNKFMEFLGKSSMGGGGPEEDDEAYKWSKSYLSLMSKGYWTKHISYTSGMEPSSEILKEATQVDLPPSDFEPPSGSKKVGFMELFQSMMGQ